MSDYGESKTLGKNRWDSLTSETTNPQTVVILTKKIRQFKYKGLHQIEGAERKSPLCGFVLDRPGRLT